MYYHNISKANLINHKWVKHTYINQPEIFFMSKRGQIIILACSCYIYIQLKRVLYVCEKIITQKMCELIIIITQVVNDNKL